MQVMGKSSIDITPIRDYLESLIARYPAISSVWLMGSRANGAARPDSDWDLMVFADATILERLKSEEKQTAEELNIDLFVVYDGDNFEKPFWNSKSKTPKGDSLTSWRWRTVQPNLALYRRTNLPWEREPTQTRKAIKIWPD
ncbi:MAG: nucleotidyltransferase domain-containing protein [Candidatus Dadabacteria bacterium]|nr:MAG: nucleotidyltransferase domain-containing protein [Candidatus Dadabacteria bacterium]